MKPIEFKHQNTVFAKDQSEYQPLPALRIDSPQGEVISCWHLSFKERLKVLITGRIWMSLMSFNKPLTPSFLSVNRKDVYLLPADKKRIETIKTNIEEKAIRSDWWCPHCGEEVPNICVTFDERHDEAFGGCGFVCQPKSIYKTVKMK